MSKKVREIFIFLVFFLLIVFLIFLYLKKSSQKISEEPKISSIRIIVVDKNLNILQIISNTKKEVEPTVRLENQSGMELSLTDFINKQYQEIKPTVNFSKAGVVYDVKPLTFFGIGLPDSFNRIYFDIKRAFAFEK